MALNHLSFAARTLRRAPAFSLAVVLTLALGFGANTAVFSALEQLLLRPLPYPEPDRLVALHETQTGKGFRPVSLPNLLDWRAQAGSFEAVAGFLRRSFGLRGGSGEPGTPVSVIQVGMITGDFFSVLATQPLAGRSFSEQEEIAAAPVIVITERLWKRQFHRSSGVLGSVVQLNEESRTVIGILPPGFDYLSPGNDVDAFIPLSRRDYNGRGTRPLEAIARLKPGVSAQAGRTELRAIGQRLAQAWPEENMHGGADLEPLADAWRGSYRQPLLLLQIGAAVLLVIACTNVMSLMLARALGRSREMAIRTALGAGTWDVARQLSAEAFLLCLSGGAAGLVLAFALLRGLPFVIKTAPPADVTLNGATLAFGAALCAAATLLFGLAPALFTRRAAANTFAKEDPGGRTGWSWRLRQSLVAGQVALSLVLLLSAGLFARVLHKLVTRHPGFETAQVYYFGFGLPELRYDERKSVDFHDKLRQRLAAIPGVESAGPVWRLPLNGRNLTTTFQFAGAGLPESQWSWLAVNVVDAAYFEALRIPLHTGRNFSWDADRPGRQPAVIVNRTFERMFAGDGGALGKRVELRWRTELTPKSTLWQIAGVAADTYQRGLDTEIRPQVYIPVSQAGLDGGVYLVRTSRTDPGLPRAIEQAVAAVDPGLERITINRLDDWVSNSLGPRRLPAILTGALAAVGLLLTAVGLYGILAYQVGQRRREIAVRIALGASPSGVVRLILRQGLLLVAAGAFGGAFAFAAASRVIGAQLTEVSPADPLTIAAVLVVLGLSAASSAWLPARRAARLDPMRVLRES